MTTHFEGFEMAREILETPEFKNLPFLIQTSIDILTTTKASVQDMAREFRKDPNYKDLQVLLVKNVTDGSAGIDYRTENGESVWFPVHGFVRKPVDAARILPEVKRLLN
jgi:hypothetical protein